MPCHPCSHSSKSTRSLSPLLGQVPMRTPTRPSRGAVKSSRWSRVKTSGIGWTVSSPRRFLAPHQHRQHRQHRLHRLRLPLAMSSPWRSRLSSANRLVKVLLFLSLNLMHAHGFAFPPHVGESHPFLPGKRERKEKKNVELLRLTVSTKREHERVGCTEDA